MADEATREKETQRKPKQTDKSKAEGKDTFRAFRDMAGRGNPREGTEAETEAEGREIPLSGYNDIILTLRPVTLF